MTEYAAEVEAVDCLGSGVQAVERCEGRSPELFNPAAGKQSAVYETPQKGGPNCGKPILNPTMTLHIPYIPFKGTEGKQLAPKR